MNAGGSHLVTVRSGRRVAVRSGRRVAVRSGRRAVLSIPALLSLAAATLLGAVTAPLAAWAAGPSSATGSPSGPNGSGPAGLAGYSADLQALGVQVAFDIPGLLPLPDQNIVEADAPFARTTVTAGPVVQALGAPYYPGDVAANLGGLIGEFAPPGTPPFPNDPLLAEAAYPPAPGHGARATFGGTPPPGSPLAPDVFSATATAGATSSTVRATLVNVTAGAPTRPSSAVLRLGPANGVRTQAGTAAGGALSAVTGGVATLAGGAVPLVDVGTVESANALAITASAVVGTASTILRDIDIAGIVDISELTSHASGSSDGSTGRPSTSIHLVGVTVEGQPATIDSTGVHVTGTTVTAAGVTPAAAQQAVDDTLRQDGITVEVAKATSTTSGAASTADTGGVVVTFTHAFSVPYVPGEPTIPLPALGNQGLPAGTYTAITSVTLGMATSDVQASALPSLGGLLGPLLGGLAGATGTGVSGAGLGTAFAGSGGLAGGGLASGGLGGQGPAGSPATLAAGGESSTLSAAPASHVLGLPVPLGWLVAGLLLCLLLTYPLLLVVRWQFLVERKR